MKHKKRITFLCAALLLFLTATPALANNANDKVGIATTLYQEYLTNGATGDIEVASNVIGQSPTAENYINDSLNLATRLVPFSLDVGIQYYSNVNPTTFFITFRGRDYNDLNQQVQSRAKAIVAAANIYENDYEKLRYINNYIVDHCEYFTAAVESPRSYPLAFTSYGCLIEGQSVCEGYANSVQLLCEMMDIPCIKVTGSAYGGDHIWNAVYLEGKWWMLDVTFNDPVSTQNSSSRWTYFLLDLDTFQQKGTHTYDRSYYETSKEIYTGRTSGQRSVALPFAGLSLQNAVSGDLVNGGSLTNINTNTNTTTDTNASTTTDTDTNTNTTTNSDTTTGMSTQAKAEALHELGLFAGDEGGFRLEDSMTRIEMGVMVMRMNDGIAALQVNGDYYAQICPFTDVPQWARSSIGFLYDEKLAAGQSATTFGTNAVSKQDYAVMMLRVLGISHSYDNALSVAVSHGVLTDAEASGSTTATRGDIVNMTYATLQLLDEQAAA